MIRAGYIYVIKNLVNGKCYVGQTIHPETRWKEHLRASQKEAARVNNLRRLNETGFQRARRQDTSCMEVL